MKSPGMFSVAAVNNTRLGRKLGCDLWPAKVMGLFFSR